VILGIAFAVLLAVSALPSMTGAAYAANTLTVNAFSTTGEILHMYTTIKSGGSTVKTGFTPLTITGTTDAQYTVQVYNYGNYAFSHWGGGSGSSNPRTLTLWGDTTATAYFGTGSSEHDLTVRAYTTGGSALSMYATIKSGSTTVDTGHTPFTYEGTDGRTYVVTAQNYGNYVFDHWGNGGTNPSRSITLESDVTAVAYYRTGSAASSPPPSSPSPTSGSGNSIISKTGAFVALYMYPGSSGSSQWQKVLDEKKEHPSVPVVVAFNPSSGPGSYKDGNIANWVAKLRGAGVIMLGYTADDYGTRSLSSLKADADKYKNWYNADGLFLDEFTNKVGYEKHYGDLTWYVKSIGMKLTMGNPGTDVPPSYIGKVDVINTSEGRGYISLSDANLIGSSWVSGGYSGWHEDRDKRNFAVIRYDVGWLDTNFVNGASDNVGLMYITNGNDSNARWFHVSPYFGQMMDALD
jgi:hypothetical protein